MDTNLKQYVIDIPDFPKPGILFRDVSALLRDHFADSMSELDSLFTEEEWSKIDYVAGVESRGFILAAALAAMRGKGFVPIRKKGKLPPPIVDMAYDLEYGSGVLEMQKGKGNILLVDDVLATGGTLRASIELSRVAGFEIVGVGVLVDLKLDGDFEWREHTARTVIAYNPDTQR